MVSKRLIDIVVVAALVSWAGGCAPTPPPPPDGIVIEEAAIHLGDDEVKRFASPAPGGALLARKFAFSGDPAGPWGLRLTVRDVSSPYSRDFEKGMYRDEVKLNGHGLAFLNEYVDDENGAKVDVVIPVPPTFLKAGENSLEIGAGGNKNAQKPNLDDFEVSGIALVPLCRLRVRVKEEGSGRALPAKVSARGIGGTPDPRFGPYYLAARAGYTVFTAKGEAILNFPRGGSYRLTVSRGFEYTVAEFDFPATGGDAVQEVELRRCLDTSGYVACDFHLHSDPSGDSRVPIEDRVTCCAAEGLEFIVATDHNIQTDYAPAIQAVGLGSWLKSAVGNEITTHGPAIGHFNAFPLKYDPARPGNGALDAGGLTPRSLLDRVDSAAAIRDRVLQINHPRSAGNGYFEIFGMHPETLSAKDPNFHLDFQSIEVFNGITDPGQLDRVLKDWFSLLNHSRPLCATGNSDSHKCVMQDAGYARTFVRVPEDSDPARVRVEEIVDSVRAGRAVVSSGPFIRATMAGREAVGEMFAGKEGALSLNVEVQAAPWVALKSLELIENGAPVQRIGFPPSSGEILRMKQAFPLNPAKDAWYVVIVEGESYRAGAVTSARMRPVAFTNPIRIDADGNGRFEPAPAK
ncbi:MAG: CehA/McbA family metallohydrolase [Planctomycetes bacterium]|nr:CehA/McbA family metallohydrolase [Planctomycetota bacterium]